MPRGVGIECSQGLTPNRITVGFDPIGVDAVDADHWKPTIACRVFVEVVAVGGADDAAGSWECFNATSVWPANVVDLS